MERETKTIAVCFSSPANRKLIADYLSSLGYAVVDQPEDGGVQADLFILDIPCARRIGRRVLALKNDLEFFLPAVVALGNQDPINPWLAAGFDDCIRMPFTKAELKARLAVLLRVREQSEELAQRSETRYQAIFEGTGAATVLIDEDTTILMANQTCLPVTGYSPGELIGTKWVKYVAPESLSIMLKYHKARRADPAGAPIQYETRLIHKAGQVRDTLLSVHMMPGTRQSVVSMIDITERKRAEEALRESEARFRRLAENADDIIYRYELSPRRGFTYVSPAATSITGYTPEEHYGDPDLGLKLVHPDDRALLDQCFSGGGAFGQPITLRWTRKDGNLVWTEQRNVPIFDDAGNLVAIEGIARDVTERVRAQQTVMQMAQEWRRTFDAMSDAVWILSETQCIRQWNAAAEKFFARPDGEIAGRTCWEIVHGAAQPIPDCPFRRAQKSLAKEAAELQVGGRWVELTVDPLLDTSGRFAGAIHAARDITSRKRAEQEKRKLEDQLRQAQKMEAIGRLAGGVAHDFNNMLNVILGYAGVVLSNLAPDDPMREDVEEIVNAGQRSAELTRQLLAFSRKQTLQPEVLDLNDLLKALERLLRRLIGEDVQLVLALGADLARVRADRGQLEQVIVNLAVNARDAMPQGGKLTIETANAELDDIYAREHPDVVAGSYVMIAVTDTGCGMDKETRANIFDPFFTTKERGQGTGLGLSTVYGIIRQSGGYIWVYSEKGKGSTFKIYLPITGQIPTTQHPIKPAMPATIGGVRILVVEDEVAVRRIVERMLNEIGYKVTAVSSAEEAMRLVEEEGVEPDLVITDVVMPGMRGTALVEYLRTYRPHIKVLYMSGYTDNAIVHHGVLDPGTPFIEKPFNIRDLAASIAQALGAD